jgi:hypothetical protein
MEMRSLKIVAASLVTASLSACGGGDSGTDGMGGIGGEGTTYDFVAPQVNLQRNYSQTFIDNSNNTIVENFTDTISSVAADSSYVVTREDPSHNSVTVNGTIYVIENETLQFNNSGQETSSASTTPNGTPLNCTYQPHGTGPDYPLTVGKTWGLQYNFTCGTQAPVAYAQTGTVVDVESVTVPAGTYSALILQSTLTWIDPNGTTHTQTVTNWRDINTMFPVKQTIATSLSGTLPTTSYPVSTQLVLESEP